MRSETKRANKAGDIIAVPAPTPWPFVTAFGLALIFAGLVTSLAVSVIGLLVLLRGAVGWFRNVFPVPQEELVAIDLRAVPVPRSSRRVDHLQPGSEGHRVFIPVAVHPYSAGLFAGAVGGAGMAIIACLYGLITQGSIWYPVNLLAAAALPSLTNAGPEVLSTFQTSGFIVALIIHLVVSLFVGLLFAAILPMMPSRFTAFWGSFLAPVLWTALIASTLDLINPALNAKIAWGWFIASQVAYGLITGYIVAHSKSVETSQAWPLAARAGIEAPGLMPGEEQ
ncbi:MAG TPA: hypothetical protein VFI24_13525 [Pyrinomonadaceae bacterium]|nr:hypothetical protein [Pyrinomonadaceae bacterium]